MTEIIVMGILSCRNLSHNLLHGPIGDVFTGLDNLKEMYVFFSWSFYLPLNMYKMNKQFNLRSLQE